MPDIVSINERVIEQEPQGSRAHAARTLPSREVDTQIKLRNAIWKFQQPLVEMVARDANEGDTRRLETAFLREGLGFDRCEHLTMEYAVIEGEFADYGLRIENQLTAFIEIKRATTTRSERQLRRIEIMYALSQGLEWMVLTNGGHWQVYHLSSGKPAQTDLVLDVNLLADGTIAQKATPLSLFALEANCFVRQPT